MSCREAGIPTGLGSSDQVGVGEVWKLATKVGLGVGCVGKAGKQKTGPGFSVNVGTLADEDTWKQGISRLLWANLNFFFFF